MNALQKLDPRDPFTQALAVLTKEPGAILTKESVEEKLIPVVTQLAVRIGAIRYEREVTEMVLPLLTGTVSLYLTQQTKGAADIDAWVQIVRDSDISLLFRSGFTMVHNSIDMPANNADFSGWLGGDLRKERYDLGQGTLDQLKKLSSFRINGVWAGYQKLQEEMIESKKMLAEFTLAKYMASVTGVEIDLRSDEILSKDPHTIICRVLLNVLHNGKASARGSFEGVVKIALAAKSDRQWWARAERNLEGFLQTLTAEHQEKLMELLEKPTCADAPSHEYLVVNSLWRINSGRIKTRKMFRSTVEVIQILTGLMPESVRRAQKSEQELWEEELELDPNREQD